MEGGKGVPPTKEEAMPDAGEVEDEEEEESSEDERPEASGKAKGGALWNARNVLAEAAQIQQAAEAAGRSAGQFLQRSCTRDSGQNSGLPLAVETFELSALCDF